VSIAWTQLRTDTGAAFAYGQLQREATKYTVRDPYQLQNEYVVGTPAARALSPYSIGGELKNFADGGASIIYIGSVSGLNFDVMKLDIATGQVERVSRDAEYDEEVGQSPDGESYIVYSTRTPSTPRLAVFAQMERPYFANIGFGAAVGEMRNDFNGQRNFQAFLFDKYGSRQGYTGQLIREPTADYPATIGVPRWSKDGRMVLFYEQLDSGLWRNENDGRIVIAHLADRVPVSPLPIVTAPDPSSWAQTFDSYHASGNFNGTWRGKKWGRADVQHLGTTFLGSMKVTYYNYSDDGYHFLNGTENFKMNILKESTYDANVTQICCKNGSLTASLKYDVFGKKSSGSIQSTVDGVTLIGPPQQ
jgi:hypothetical protein